MPYLLKRVINVQRVTCVTNDICDWGDSEILVSLAFGELRFRSKTKAGPLEAEQLSRLGNIALVS